MLGLVNPHMQWGGYYITGKYHWKWAVPVDALAWAVTLSLQWLIGLLFPLTASFLHCAAEVARYCSYMWSTELEGGTGHLVNILKAWGLHSALWYAVCYVYSTWKGFPSLLNSEMDYWLFDFSSFLHLVEKPNVLSKLVILRRQS